MAHIALLCRAQVARRLAGRSAAVVTGIALARRAGIVEPGATNESGRGVAVMAIQRGRNVRVVLTGRGHAVTGRAVVDDTGVIEHRADERRGVMTDTAVLVGRHVADRFSDREDVVVTRTAVVHDTGVVKRRRYKARGHVTGIAIVTGRHMVGWRCFALGRRAVMAGCTVVHDAAVIKPGTDERRGDMAQGAILRRRQVARRLAGRGYTVMAGCAIVDNAGMIEHRGHEGAAGNMTDTTILASRHMIRLRVLAGGIDSIVAGVTPGSKNLGTVMVDKRIGKIGRVMTHGTVTAGVLVNWRIRRWPGAVQANIHKIAVMTGGAVAGDTGVRKYRRTEYIHRMAQFTVLCCWQVTGRLDQLGPARNEALVMTAFATASDPRMNRRKECCRREHIR